jgi:Uri superfamily endonuclease
MAAPGSYLLVIECETPTEIEVGALGTLGFEAGYYGYVGSAFGPGGLSRVDRHRRVAAGDHEVRHLTQ